VDLLIISLGTGCLFWTAHELLRLSAIPVAHRPSTMFGAVDLDTGRPLDVVFDRRSNPRDDQGPTRSVHFRA